MSLPAGLCEAWTDELHLISFDQKDTFGQAGYDGLVAAYTALQGPKGLTALPSGVDPIKRFRYERESGTSATDQGKQVGEYIKGVVEAASTETHTFGIEMTDTYAAGDPFIRALETWKSIYPNKDRVKIVYSNVSVVGPNSLPIGSKARSSGTIRSSFRRLFPITCRTTRAW